MQVKLQTSFCWCWFFCIISGGLLLILEIFKIFQRSQLKISKKSLATKVHPFLKHLSSDTMGHTVELLFLFYRLNWTMSTFCKCHSHPLSEVRDWSYLMSFISSSTQVSPASTQHCSLEPCGLQWVGKWGAGSWVEHFVLPGQRAALQMKEL